MPRIFNGGLSYRTPMGKLFVSLITNYHTPRPRFSELGIIRNRQQDTGVAWTFSAKVGLAT